MQSISEVLNKLFSAPENNDRKKALYQAALNDELVQKFLHDHQAQLSEQALKKGLSVLYQFHQARVDQAKGQSAIVDFAPELFVSSGEISLRFVPNQHLQAREKAAAAVNYLTLVNASNNLRSVSLDKLEVDDGNRDAVTQVGDFLVQYKQNPHQRGLYLAGDYGVGKTYLLAAMANSLVEDHVHVVFFHVPTFIASLSSHFNDNSLSETIMSYAQAPVLILDDIGAESLSAWARDDVLGVILQARMDNNLPTFFSSNFSMDELEEHFAQTRQSYDTVKAKRLMERVRYLAREVLVQGKNRRRID